MKPRYKLIVIGTSAGGVTAIQEILQSLSLDVTIPIVITQHLPPQFNVNIATVFGSYSKGIVREAIDKDVLQAKHVYFSPPGYHLLIESKGSLALSQDEPVHYSRPSIDLMFESAANAFGSDLIGILLTGANYDGASGLKHIKDLGGYTIVQNPLTAEVDTMPREAIEMHQPDKVLNLNEIAEHLSEICSGAAHG